MDIKKIEILLFDTHLALNPLLDPSLVQPELSWLFEQQEYEKRYRGEAPIPSTAHFDIWRVYRETRHNLFWKAYAQATSGVPMAWSKVLPFRFVPKREYLELHTSAKIQSAETRVRAWTLVWPFGWSSNLHVKLQGPLTLAQLRDQNQLLLGAEAFQAGQDSLSLSDVFRRLSGGVKADLYTPGKLIGDFIHLPRYSIIAVTASDPPFPRYDDAKLAQSDWARIFGVLLGRQVTAEEVSDLNNKLTITKYGDYGGFAVTDFDRGTFLLLSGAAERGMGERSSSCMAHNVETALLIGLIFSGFLQAAKKIKSSSPALAELVNGAQNALTLLPDFYGNRLCREVWQAHGSLKSYWSPS